VLKKEKFTATCYGVSQLIGGTNIWDNGLVSEKLLMNIYEWKDWISSGMEVGSHTSNHANLLDISDEDAWNEIANSKTELENSLNTQVRHFCYPYGKYNENRQRMVFQAGYTSATTTDRGKVELGSDFFKLNRIMIARATNPIQFFLKIHTNYENRRS
jgi:peptidoglycan/xylan/chitin deacetylase (PgdA/CDA1 family)